MDQLLDFFNGTYATLDLQDAELPSDYAVQELDFVR